MFQTQRQMAFNIILMILGENLALNFAFFLVTSILTFEFYKKGIILEKNGQKKQVCRAKNNL